MYNIGQSRKGLLYKANIPRKVFILEQFRLCSMVTIQKCLLPPQKLKALHFKPKRSLLFHMSSFYKWNKDPERSDSSSKVTYLKMRSGSGPLCQSSWVKALEKKGNLKKHPILCPKEGPGQCFPLHRHLHFLLWNFWIFLEGAFEVAGASSGHPCRFWRVLL